MLPMQALIAGQESDEAAIASWETILFRFKGWKMKVQIADVTGHHHSPVRHYTLEKLERTEERELKLYFNSLQFISVPLFVVDDTKLMNTAEGGRFLSHDRARDLIYTVDFYL